MGIDPVRLIGVLLQIAKSEMKSDRWSIFFISSVEILLKSDRQVLDCAMSLKVQSSIHAHFFSSRSQAYVCTCSILNQSNQCCKIHGVTSHLRCSHQFWLLFIAYKNFQQLRRVIFSGNVCSFCNFLYPSGKRGLESATSN